MGGSWAWCWWEGRHGGMLYCDTGGVSGGDDVEPREREATKRRAGVVGGVGVGERPALGGGVGAGGGLTPGTV